MYSLSSLSAISAVLVLQIDLSYRLALILKSSINFKYKFEEKYKKAFVYIV